MATVTFTIPDAIVSRVNNGIANYHGYQETLPDNTPNPESKAQFAKRKLKETLKAWVVASESNAGFLAAQTTANSEVDIQD